MPLQQLNKYLINRPPTVPSATLLAKRYDMETTSVSRILKRLGYIRTTDGWYLPQSQHPFAISQETANKLLSFSRDKLLEIYLEETKKVSPDKKKVALACVGIILHDVDTRPIIL